MSNPIHDVTVLSNVFKSDRAGQFGVQIGSGLESAAGLPERISVVNNTILAGRVSAIRVSPDWAKAPAGARPIVANNILGISRGDMCPGAQTSRNLVVEGRPCGGDLHGSASLDSSAAPTKASTRVLDQADGRYAPRSDYFGRFRNGPADIGAIERGGLDSETRAAVRRPRLEAPSTLVVSGAELRKVAWRMRFRVTLSGSTLLGARLVRLGRTLLTRSFNVAGRTVITLSIRLPRRARKPGRLTLVLRAASPEGAVARRTIAIRMR